MFILIQFNIKTNHNLLGKGWTKTQPFKKRLDQKFIMRTHFYLS